VPDCGRIFSPPLAVASRPAGRLIAASVTPWAYPWSFAWFSFREINTSTASVFSPDLSTPISSSFTLSGSWTASVSSPDVSIPYNRRRSRRHPRSGRLLVRLAALISGKSEQVRHVLAGARSLPTPRGVTRFLGPFKRPKSCKNASGTTNKNLSY
jgi:hypothetical protein